MKWILSYTFVLLILALATPATGQCPSNMAQLEIAASYGLITGDELAAQFSTTDNISGFAGKKTVTDNPGAMFITVRYFPFNRLAIGFSGGVKNERGQYADRVNPSFVSGTYKQKTTVIAMEFYYIYYFRKYVEVYTLLGFGPAFINTETTTNPSGTTSGSVKTASTDKFKMHYSPVGVRVGGRLGGFLELGLGYKGLVNAGISFKLGSSCWWRQ